MLKCIEFKALAEWQACRASGPDLSDAEVRVNSVHFRNKGQYIPLAAMGQVNPLCLMAIIQEFRRVFTCSA